MRERPSKKGHLTRVGKIASKGYAGTIEECIALVHDSP